MIRVPRRTYAKQNEGASTGSNAASMRNRETVTGVFCVKQFLISRRIFSSGKIIFAIHAALDSDGMTGGRTHRKLELGVERHAPILLLRRGARAFKLLLTLLKYYKLSYRELPISLLSVVTAQGSSPDLLALNFWRSKLRIRTPRRRLEQRSL